MGRSRPWGLPVRVAFILSVILIASCQRKGGRVLHSETSQADFSEAAAGVEIFGRVTDLESGEPVAHVRVKVNAIAQEASTVEATTDGLGLFGLALQYKGPASIWAEKDGYSPQSQILQIGSESDSIQLKLRPVTFVQDMDVTPEMKALEVKVPDNSLSVVIPNPSESLGVNGPLRAEITVGDPRQDQDAFPGGFMAVNDVLRSGRRGSPKRILRRQADGSGSEIVELVSVMLGNITLRDADGNVVSSLAQPAKVRMKIPPGTMNPSTNAPFRAGDTIPTYYIDEQLGTWVPEVDESGEQVLGTIVEGPDGIYNEFLARHFSWWNLDQPVRTRGCVRGRVADLCGQPQAGYRVCGKGVSFNGATCNGVLGTAARELGIGSVDKREEPTASDGKFCLDALKGSTIDLQVGKGGNWGWSTFSFDTTFKTQTVVMPGTEGTCANPASSCQDLGDIGIGPVTQAVTGEVVDSEDLPVQSATVFMGEKLTRSDAQGRFRLDSAPSEGLMMVITSPRGVKAGQAKLAVNVPGMSPVDPCAVPPPVDLGIIRLESNVGCARGKVRDENGNPVSGSTLTVAGAVVQTDAGGNYCLESEPGETEIVFNYYDRGRGRTHNKRSPVQIVGGGYCGGGETRCAHADIDVVLGPSCVSGTVADQRGRPLAGVSIRAGSRMVTTGTDGSYCLEAPAQQKVRLKFKYAAASRNGGGSETDEEEEVETGGAGQCGAGCTVVNRSIMLNEPPVISRIEPSKSVVLAGEEITISVDASDPEGDRLSFTWAASCGDLSKPKPQPGRNAPNLTDSDPLIDWKAPSSEGTCAISVVAEDPKKGSALAGIVVKVERDTTPPSVAISSQPSAISNSTSASVEFSCSDTSDEQRATGNEQCTFFCQLDIGTPSPCSSPHSITGPLSDGSHSFAVQAIDAAGNKDPTPATFTWTVDTTPPSVAISSQPSAISNSTSASVEFSCSDTSNEQRATGNEACAFACSLDSASFASCSSPTTLNSLLDGVHAFAVQAVDAAGNKDPTPATFTWTVDTTPPSVAISSQPSAISNSTSATVTFSCSDPVGAGLPAQTACSFSCSLDAASFASCTSPNSYTGLADGSHTFDVKAIDPVGNSSSAVSYRWTIDTTAPSAPDAAKLSVTQNPPGTNDTLSGAGGAVEAGSSVRIYSDGLLTTVVGGPQTADGTGAFAAISIGDNANATVYLTATDAAGNPSGATAKSNDIAPPTATSIDINSGAGITNTTAATLTLAATGATETVLSNDNVTYGVYQAYATSSAWILSAGDGTKTVYAKFRDSAGNASSPVSDTIVLDTGPPETAIGSQPPALGNSTSALFTFTSNDTGATFECSLDSAAFSSCASPLTLSPLTNGGHTFDVRARDQANNVDATPATYAWTVDTTAPAAPVSGNITVNENPPGTSDSVQGSLGAVEAASTVKVYSDAGLTSPVVSGAAATNGSFGPLNIGDNLYPTVYITATDAAGNQSASITRTNNTSGSANPTLTVADQTSGSTGYTNSTTVNATIGNDADATAWCLSVTQSTQPASSSPCFTSPEPTTFSLTAVEGSHTVYVWTKNSAGNVNPGPAVSASITLDTVAPSNPTVSLADQTSSSASSTNSVSVNAVIGGDAEAAFWCLSETQSTSPAELSSCFTSPRPATLAFSAGDGSKTAYLWIKDTAGNINAGPAVSASITLDTSAPPNPTLGLSDVTSGSAAATNAVAINISITGDTGASTWCLSETQATAPAEADACFVSPKPATFTLSAVEGSHTVYVWIKDAAGNINAGPVVSAGITLDTAAPPNPALGLSDATSGSGSVTNSTLINASITGDTGASTWCLSETQATAPAEADACFVSPEPTTFTLSAVEGSHTVYVWIKDAAGNINAGPAVSASITLDTSAPPNPTLSVADPSPTTSGYTNNNPVNATIGNDAEAVAWCLSESQSTQPTEGNTCFVSSQPTTHNLSAGDGAKTVYVWVRDAAGNVNPGPAISASVTLDTVAPTAPTAANLTVTANPPGTNDTLSGAAGAVEGSATVKVYSDGLLTTAVGGPQTADGTGAFAPFSIGDNQGNGSDQVYVTQTDLAGNTSPPTTKINDKTPPPNPTLSLTDPSPAAAGYTNNNPVNATIGNDAQAAGWCLSETQSTAPAAAHACFVGSQPTTRNLSAGDGAKTVYLWVKDAAGNVNVGPAVSATITLDTTLPTGGAVNDGTGADVAYQISNTTMDANWSGFSDANGIASYDYNISTAGSCTGDTLAATNLGNVASKSTGALTLALGASYYNCVRALDNAGNVSAWAASNGVMVDFSLPASSITAPANGAKLSALSSVTGSASDTGSGVQKVEITVYDGASYWDGAAWGGLAWLVASGTTSWSYATVPAWTSGTTYTIQSKATDNAANAQSPASTASFTFDNTAPTFAGLASATAVSSSQIDLSWSAASDAVSPASSLIYKICQSTTAGTCQTTFTATYTTAAGDTFFSATSLASGVTYFFVARAEDEAGNADTNTVEKTATTSGGSATGAVQTVMTHIGNHTCALLVDGTVQCWGFNGYGQLGDGTTTNRSTPVTVFALSNAIALAEGYWHTCSLLSNGTVKCWGSNYKGQLGDGTTSDRLAPVAVSALSGAVAVSGGNNHTCSLLSDGTIQCWGNNEYGQLGDGTTTSQTTAVAVSTLSGVIAVAAGAWHTCSLLSNGSVRCWGNNASGQLGDVTTANRATPVAVSSLSGVVAVAGGAKHTCSLLSDGTIRCWGYNAQGQIGDGTTVNRTTPVAVTSLSIAVTVTTANHHACSLLSDGTIKCWGYNQYGQLGDGTTMNRTIPVAVSTLSGVTIATAGYAHTCALTSDGTVKCWGANSSAGQLGDGTMVDKWTPVAVTSLTGTLGVKLPRLHESTASGAPARPFREGLVGGLNYTCALVSDGTARCWGDNASGQLGDGGTVNRSTPVAVVSLSNAVSIATGEDFTCALPPDGSVKCWGNNTYGQLGDGTTANKVTPTEVLLLSTVLAIGGGNNHACAILSDGTVKCWGYNFFAQLGDGTTADKLIPVAVSSLSNVVALASGNNHNCVLPADGTVKCWGQNSQGQLGIGDTLQQSTPVAVSSLSSAVAVAGGNWHTCALLSDGTVKCWGNNLW